MSQSTSRPGRPHESVTEERRTATQRRKARRRLGVAAALTALGVLTLTATASSASASDYNDEFDAYCQVDHAITAWSPDLTHVDSAWTLAWGSILYRWTTSGWQPYLTGDVQVLGGGDWMGAQSWTYTGLPRGYYQVRDVYSWAYNGAEQTQYTVQAVHKLNGNANYIGSSYPTLLYSNPPDSCFMS